jgi:2-polyprenyl-6-methoxyphenol hydroxylase-like FAD-dependent oxidoreductase
MARRILITGASIAGNTAAWWLAEHGFEVVVVERSTEFRDGGQNIDIRGEGRDVLRLMGLEQQALQCGTGEQGTAWIDRRGRTVASIMVDEVAGDGPTAEMEILRGDLARLIYEPASKRADFRFGDSIEQIDDTDDMASVTFASGRTERFDAVVVAEGVGSATRELVFPHENMPRWMNMTIGYFTIPRTPTDRPLWRWYNGTDGRSVTLRPDNHGTTRAALSIQKTPGGEQDWDVARQKQFLRERFVDAGWEAQRVLAAMDTTEDFYFDVLRQVRIERWSRGCVALTGDAAWCATPLAGIGATLAVTGAYVLAGELSRHDDATHAFDAYERIMRPIALKAQKIPKIGPRLLNPHSAMGIRALHAMLRIATKPRVRNFASRIFTRQSEDRPRIPRY